ncbi:MAG: hypothetical protein ACPGPE_00695 [Planctomycetota bacterium]|jgi:hypothetical protein
MISRLRLALAGLFAGVALSCAATTYQTIPTPAPPRGDMSRIYAARSTQRMGRFRSVEIIVIDQTVGRPGEAGHLCWDLPAGRTVVQALFHGSAIDGKPVEAVFGFDGEGGRRYCYGMCAVPGNKKATAQPLGEEQARALIERRKAPEVRETP